MAITFDANYNVQYDNTYVYTNNDIITYNKFLI